MIDGEYEMLDNHFKNSTQQHLKVSNSQLPSFGGSSHINYNEMNQPSG